MVSIALTVDWLEPKNPKDKTHVAAAKRAMDFKWGWTAQPIFGDGKYPEVMRKELGRRLPKFSTDDKKAIKGISNRVYMSPSGHYGHYYPVTNIPQVATTHLKIRQLPFSCILSMGGRLLDGSRDLVTQQGPLFGKLLIHS